MDGDLATVIGIMNMFTTIVYDFQITDKTMKVTLCFIN